MLSENIIRTQMITKWNNYFQHNEIKAYDVIIYPPGQGQKESRINWESEPMRKNQNYNLKKQHKAM